MPGVQIDPSDVTACYPELTVLGRLGNGTFKQVFKVSNSANEEFVIKCVQLDVDDFGQITRMSAVEERLRLEVGLMAAVDDPHVPSLGPIESRDFTKQGFTVRAFSEEFIGEQTVESLLGLQHFDAVKLKKLLHDVASALKVYNDHETGFVHRDVKPGNIVLRESDQSYVLIDPGVHLAPSNPTISNPADWPQGTPAYYSPEQAQGTRRQLDVRSDMFSLGIIAYQAITGTHPFNPTAADPAWLGRLINAQYNQLDTATYPDYASCIPIVHKLLGRFPHARYNSPEALLLMVEEL